MVSCIPGGLLSTLLFRSEILNSVSNKSLYSTVKQKMIWWAQKRNSTVGQLLLVQLGLHVKLENSSQRKTLALVNVERDLLHFHVPLQHLLIGLHFNQSILSSPWEILLFIKLSRVNTWSSGWEGFYSPPTLGSPSATWLWKDRTKERYWVDLEWTESAQASLTGLCWLWIGLRKGTEFTLSGQSQHLTWKSQPTSKSKWVEEPD